MRIQISPPSCQLILLSDVLILTVLGGIVVKKKSFDTSSTGVKLLYLIVVWICIYLMSSDAMHLFIYVLAIYLSLLKECVFKLFITDKIRLFVFFYY